MRLPKEAEILQGAAVIVAAPRYMGAFAAAIGISLVTVWPWFAAVEIGSGAAMALVEGFAIAFVFRRWRSMRVKSMQWKILLVLQIVLMLALPAIAAPYLVASQLNEPAHTVLSPALLWLWSLLVAAIAPLVLAAVGYADAQPVGRASKEPAKSQHEPAPERYVCQHCNRTFPTHQALNAHSGHCEKKKEANGRPREEPQKV